MSNASNISHAQLNQWFKNQLQESEVAEKLASQGYDENGVIEHLKEYARIKHAKRLSLGFIYIGLGAFLGFLSCVLTMAEVFPALNNFFLYGLTSIAVALAMLGFYFVFE